MEIITKKFRKGLSYVSYGFLLACCMARYGEAQSVPNEKVGEKVRAPFSSENPPDSAKLIKNSSDFLKDIHLNLFLRNTLEIPSENQSASIKINEMRLALNGKIQPDLSFKIRLRLNKPLIQNTSDNAAGSIDHASINWDFGENKKWSLDVGKQSAALGSFEFENNPAYEYQYSDFINYQTNIFVTGARLGYQLNQSNALYLQLHNTWNDSFETVYKVTAYHANGLEAAKLPLGVYATWMGSFFENKWRTSYSYNISQFAKSKINQSLALGNKLVLPRLETYLDLQVQTLGMDFTDVTSPAINNYRATIEWKRPRIFAENINYKSAVLRVDWEFIRNWFITTKGIYENASQMSGSFKAGENFKNTYAYVVGIEYKPIKSQNMKIVGYYYNKYVTYNSTVGVANNDLNTHLFGIGFLYFVNVL